MKFDLSGQTAVIICKKACKINTYTLLLMPQTGDNYVFIDFYLLFFLYIMKKYSYSFVYYFTFGGHFSGQRLFFAIFVQVT
ncbi:hypothetical protein [Lactobacillus phage JNU_P11]|nr:hypothetical protein [Lactobacillus phage JNU_P11]